MIPKSIQIVDIYKKGVPRQSCPKVVIRYNPSKAYEKPMVVFMGITRDKSTYSNLIVVRGPRLVSDSGHSGHIAWGQMEGCRF